MNKLVLATKLNNSLATYIAGGVFVQIAEGLATEFSTPASNDEKYIKNKLLGAVKEVEKIVRPITSILDKTSKEVTAQEISKLIDLVSEVANLDPKEFKRVNNLLIKIKDERFKKNYGQHL